MDELLQDLLDGQLGGHGEDGVADLAEGRMQTCRHVMTIRLGTSLPGERQRVMAVYTSITDGPGAE